MSQIQTTTSKPTLSFTKTDLDNLSLSFDQGDIATLTAINTLIDYMQELNTHTHTVTDITYEEYGNASSSRSSSYTATTGAPNNSSTVSNKSQGDLIDDYEIDQLVNAINTLNSHYHSINDQ